ncbi:MAG TPA: UvrD-helicase domain-containing protein, partial [Sphingopyxis sp.]|nr:UvrD-helicase domain-containing protein [Sphingopyxis sp.]
MSKPSGLATLDLRQGAAADPAHHVWLGASAGTGKTQVLSARVLRLMLEGEAPESILCITFTKAGAAEMAHRIHERLAAWVRMGEGDLRLDLRALGLDWDRPGLMERARSLFATVIDSPGGAIRVQTIHSFCQTLLASFPLEAKLLPGFRPIEEDEAETLKRRVLGELLSPSSSEEGFGGVDAGAGRHPAATRSGFAEPSLAAPPLKRRGEEEELREAAANLSRRLGPDAALSFLSSCAAVFGGPGAALPPAAHDLRAAFDLPGGDPDAWIVEELAAGVVSDDDIRAVAASGSAWGTKTGEACSDVMVGWLMSDAAARAAMLDELIGCFLTGKGELRADFAGDKGRMTDCVDSAVRIVEAATALRGTATAMRVADELAAAWKLGSRFAAGYALAKREKGLADFDDLITLAGSLLRVSSFGEWVRFKLDQRTDHILVDEAQDTNMRQWGIVLSLAEEFFAVHAKDVERARTLFTVGDRKQAIFGFQGTEPKAFATARDLFHGLGARVGQDFRQVDLVSNYRSTPAVLKVVDAWLAAGGTEAMGLDGSEPLHRPHREVHAGQVELWEPLPVDKALDAAAADAGEGDEAGGDTSAPASDPASMRLARAIAGEVKQWIDHGKDGRPVAPGDVMILVRRRRDLAARIVARLQALHVPVAGVDRFALAQPLAVQDLMAAMRFAVQPLDDLNLAALLVSPLIGWSQDELYARTKARGRTPIWAHLRAQEDDMPAATMVALRQLLGMADYTTPFRFLETLLSGPIDGRRKLYARLGREARDPIDELLNQALAFEARETLSLLGFLTQVEGSASDIKRQTEARSDVVRVMTVHGSKGLQAPIVILADATDDAGIGHRPFSVDVEGREKLPVFAVPADERHGRLAEAYEAAAKAAAEEHWRLFYVAMTRAEEILVVAGVTKKADRTVPEGSWHATADAVLAGMNLDWEDAGPVWNRRRVHRANAGKWAKKAKAVKAAPPPLLLPDWAHAPAPEEARPPRPLAPSALGEDDVATPPQGTARAAAVSRGLLLHSLFERLPPVAPARRRPAALHWLAMQAPELGEAAGGALVDEVLAVLDDPAHAALFGPGSLAEVITHLKSAHPGFADRLLDDDGNLRKFVNIFVDDDDVRFLDGLATPTA